MLDHAFGSYTKFYLYIEFLRSVGLPLGQNNNIFPHPLCEVLFIKLYIPLPLLLLLLPLLPLLPFRPALGSAPGLVDM